MKFVCHLAFEPVEQMTAIAQAADEHGYAYMAVSDHVVHPEKIQTPYPYTEDGQPRWEPFTDWPDPWVSIGAMSAVTKRVRFITSVYVLPMRNPFVVAKAVGTAAVLSNNRVTLGIGMGWMKDEFDFLEQSFAKRGKRADEMVEVLRKIWGGGMVEHHGDFYDFPRLEMSPAPTEPVPVLVGGLSDRALKRAAHVGDGWISDLHTTEELRGFLKKLKELRADSPRANEPFRVFVSCMDAFDRDAYRRLEDIGVTHVSSKPWVFYNAGNDDVQAKLDGVRRFADENIR